MAMTMKKPMPDPTAASLREERARQVPILQRALALMNPMQQGEPVGPAPTALEALEAPDVVTRIRAEIRQLDIAILKAEAVENEAKRQRRAALLAEYAGQVHAEFAALVAATDAVAAQWRAFQERNRGRDDAVIHETPAGDYAVERYSALSFVPLAGDPTLGCQWTQFCAALARDWA